jgi:hypothetical protein
VVEGIVQGLGDLDLDLYLLEGIIILFTEDQTTRFIKWVLDNLGNTFPQNRSLEWQCLVGSIIQ